MPVLTTDERNLLDYLQSVYPTWLRFMAFEENSLTWNYDYVRVFAISNLFTWIKDAVLRLEATTSDVDWILERETFLKIPVNPTLSLEVRRARVLSKLSGNPATIANIRTVIESFTWGWPDTYKLIELWTETPFDVDDTWTYFVDLYDPSPTLDVAWLITILNEVHPAHCTLAIWRTKPVKDAIGIKAELSSSNNNAFIWAIDWVPAPTDVIWFWWSYIDWGYWS